MSTNRNNIFGTARLAALLIVVLAGILPCHAKFAIRGTDICMQDSVNKKENGTAYKDINDPAYESINDSVSKIITAIDSANLNKVGAEDSLKKKKKKEKRDWSTWRPDAKRAMWLAIVIPGGGQIYNRKYWKLPFVYGGFIGCIYAMRWNNQMYNDYSQAYMDIMDNDPSTESYNQFLHLGTTITPENTERYKNLFKRRKDYYRKYRDLSIFCLIGVYALSVIDAYVDASLSEFDISEDLSLKVEPTVINNKSSINPLKSSSVGLQCSLNF